LHEEEQSVTTPDQVGRLHITPHPIIPSSLAIRAPSEAKSYLCASVTPRRIELSTLFPTRARSDAHTLAYMIRRIAST
jgi:hypothetical protein